MVESDRRVYALGLGEGPSLRKLAWSVSDLLAKAARRGGAIDATVCPTLLGWQLLAFTDCIFVEASCMSSRAARSDCR